MSLATRARSALATAVAATALLTAAAPAALATGTPAASDVAAWQRSGRPDRLIVVRPGTVGLLSHGIVVRRMFTPWGTLPLSWLAANAGPGWVSRVPGKPGTVRVNAAVLLTPNTTLQITSRTPTVLMTAGTTAASGTWISGSRATLDIEGADLVSAPADGVGPASPSTPGRPYLTMGAGGRMTIRDSVITGFGRPAPAPARQSGVTWGRGSTGAASGSTFEGGRTGLRLAGSTGVTLSKVTVKDSVLDGVVLDGDRGTATSGLVAENSGRSGVAVAGTDKRTLTGVTTRGNHGAGIKATAQHGLLISGVSVHGDHGVGIRLVSCASCAVRQVTVDGTPVAVGVSGPASDVTVSGSRLSGGAGTGISLAAGIAGATLTGNSVSGFSRGIAVAASHVVIDGGTISDPVEAGIALYGQASRVALRGTRITGGRTGLTLSGTTRDVTLTGVRISGATRKGLSSASPGLRVTGGSVSGATTAVDLAAPATLDSLKVSGARRGVHLASKVTVTGTHLDVLAERTGVEADAGARMELTHSLVRAPVALAGDGRIGKDTHTVVTLPPFPWLGAAALTAISLAVLFQTIHQVRHRGTPLPQVAAHVHNTA